MWLILDLASFKPGKALPPGFLVIAEEIPTMMRTYDATPILGFGAFTSYNIPCVGRTAAAAALHRLASLAPCHSPPDSTLISQQHRKLMSLVPRPIRFVTGSHPHPLLPPPFCNIRVVASSSSSFLLTLPQQRPSRALVPP